MCQRNAKSDKSPAKPPDNCTCLTYLIPGMCSNYTRVPATAAALADEIKTIDTLSISIVFLPVCAHMDYGQIIICIVIKLLHSAVVVFRTV